MTLRRTAGLRRWAALAVGAVVLLLSSGCVYLRLLTLKRQLGEFDRYFTLQTDDGITLVAREPVLLSSDIRWLGLPPETIQQRDNTENWRVRWTKHLPPGEPEPANYDLEVGLSFRDDKLAHLHIPERYFGQLPKPFFVNLLRSLGGAQVDQKKRALDAHVASDDARPIPGRPTLKSVHDLLGIPTARSHRGSHVSLRYRYTPVSADTRHAGIFDIVLTFDAASGALQSLQGRTPVGKVSFNFSRTAGRRNAAPRSARRIHRLRARRRSRISAGQARAASARCA